MLEIKKTQTTFIISVSKVVYVLGFPTGRDSATFPDKGTEVPSLSRDKGTKGQAQNLAIQLKLFSATID